MTDRPQPTASARRAPCDHQAAIHQVSVLHLRIYAEHLADLAAAQAARNGGRMPSSLWQAALTVDSLADSIEAGAYLVPTIEQECIAVMAAQ